MSAPFSGHYSAYRINPDEISARMVEGEASAHAPILVSMPDLCVFLPHAHALRLVDQLTAALAAHKAANRFHRGAGGAG